MSFKQKIQRSSLLINTLIFTPIFFNEEGGNTLNVQYIYYTSVNEHNDGLEKYLHITFIFIFIFSGIE